MPKNNRFMIFAATVVLVIMGLISIALPPHQLPSDVPIPGDDETTR